MDQQILINSVLMLVASLVIAREMMVTAKQMTYITLADGRRQERGLPFLIRLMLPFASSAPKFITNHDSLEESRVRINRKLISSGYEGLLQPHEVIGLRFLMPLGVGGFMCVMLALVFQGMEGKFGEALAARQAAFYFLILILFGFYPDLWLKQAVRERQQKVERALPFVLDLLTLSVESGLDFMTGINRIIQSRDIDPLGEELIRMFREIQVGRSRREALHNFSDRLDLADVRSLTNALIQADELGTGIGHALRIQADQIRTKRFQRAEKLGNEAPVKMLFPLVFFIFPSVFLILLGPVVLQMVNRGGF